MTAKQVYRCSHCDGEFERYPSQAGAYCSKACHAASRAVRERDCPSCEQRFRPRHNGINYCSRQCAARRLASELSPALRQRLWKYGISAAEYEALEEEQLGFCAICHRAPAAGLVIDHDHRTERVRGLLCRPCNTLLGQARDLPYVLENALRYLRTRGHEEILTAVAPITRAE